MLRLARLADPPGAEQVQPVEKDERPTPRADEIEREICPKCWKRIERQPFYRVNDRLYHATCTRSI